MSVKHWLDSLSLTQYHELFLNSGINSLAKCTTLTDSDLDRIGVSLPGHRKRILSHLQTALHFSRRNQDDSIGSAEQTVRDESSSKEVDLIDMNSPDYVNLAGEDLKSFPISLPPKLRKKTDIDDLLGMSKCDGGLDSDKKRPVPLPRVSVRLLIPEPAPALVCGTVVPVPRPRANKPPGKQIVGVTESDSSTDDGSKPIDASDSYKSIGLVEQTPTLIKAGVKSENKATANEKLARAVDIRKQLGNGDKDDIYDDALAVMGLSMTSTNPGCDLKLSEPGVISSLVHLAEDDKALLSAGLNSDPASPDLAMTNTGSARLPVSENYEGDIEDVESSSGSDFVNIISCLYKKESSGCEVAPARDSTWYTGVWDMSSGKSAKHYRNEIKSDVSFDGFQSQDDDSEDNYVNGMSTPMAMPPLPVPDVTLVSRPAPALPSAPRPPPVPARIDSPNNAPAELQHHRNPSSSSVKLLADVDLFQNDVSGFQKPPSHSVPPLLPVSSIEEVKHTPRFPTPPLHSAQSPLEAGLPEKVTVVHPSIPVLPVRAAPTPPVVSGTSGYPPLPVQVGQTAPAPLVGSGMSGYPPPPPVPVVRVAPAPLVESGRPVLKLPARAAPTAPSTRQLEERTAIQPPIPTPPARSAPPPPVPYPVEEGAAFQLSFPTPPVRPAPTPPTGLLDVKIPTVSTAVVQGTPPTPSPRVLPPKPPPKVGVPSSTTEYFYAKDIVDDELLDEPEHTGDVSFTESDDTLSDGGEFYDIGFRRPALDVLDTSIPIIPTSPSTPKQAHFQNGNLYKLTSKSGMLTKLGPQWQRRYVVFDGRELRYYSSNKSFISKRMIPVCTMSSVETENKIGELYPFRLITIDRVYTFAVEKLDDMVIWAQVIMRAILQSKDERGSFVEGGEMNSPDIQGYVRMEGSKCKRYLVVKKPKFCYYNTQNDFRSFTPIHRVEMQVASVKDVGRCRLKLITPHIALMLIYDNQEELNQWKEAFEEAIMVGLSDDKVIEEVYTNESNRFCADCGRPKPDWAAINFGITLCKFCAGVHRSIPSSKVRSLRMDCKIWRPSVKQLLMVIGNDNSNKFWEWNVTTEAKISADTDTSRRTDFIIRKYCDKVYCRFHPFHSQQESLNEALCKMVQFGNVLETMELLFSGANILCTKDNETPIQIARKANQVLQEEFLSLNFGDAEAASIPKPGMEGIRPGMCHQGFLWKTGSNNKEFLRRWCTLDNEKLSYFDTDKSTSANKSILKKEMQSIGIVSDERHMHTFEIVTTLEGNRAFLFAAESSEDRLQWMTKLAQMIGNIGSEDADKLKAMDHGANVFVRWGSARDWEMTWSQISHKTLKIFNKKERSFKEIDLRKAKSVVYRHSSERCVESFDDGPPFVVDLRNAKYLYLQGDLRSETERWFSVIQKAMMQVDKCLENQSLTCDNVPVIVEKCISFVELYGLEVEGVYRLNGQHSKVTHLLEHLLADACNMMLKLEDFQVNDVTNALKRFFRTLTDPLLTYKLYSKWVEAAAMNETAKKQCYKDLLQKLPEINYCTLKQIITHLSRVAELERSNKMTIINLASIFGPVLMGLDHDTQSNGGFGSTNLEIMVVKDLVENHVSLFEVKEEELEQEKKIEKARKKIEMLNNQQQVESHLDQMQDVLIGVYVNNREGEVISLKVPVQMRVQELQNYVIEKGKLNADQGWSLFEVICNGELERPLHYMEAVIEVTMRWTSWPLDFCRDNYLCMKLNFVYEGIELVDDPHASMFCELKYASKKSFHRNCFEFSRYCLTYRSSARAATPTQSWNVEDLIIYLGCQKQRNPPTKFCFSFICTGEQLVSPFFGHCISCNSEEELYKWLSVLLRAQHPEGLFPSGMARMGNSPPAPPQMRSHGVNAGQDSQPETSRSRWPKPTSFFQKFNLR